MTVAVAPSGLLQRAAGILARDAGMSISPQRESDLARALWECSRRGGLPDVETYLASLEERPSSIDDLVDMLTVGETYFFRDAAQFDLIRREILPDQIGGHGTDIRTWSAGCASGEEAYSLAIALYEGGAGVGPTVLGTDISHSALRKAEVGVYGNWSFRGVPDDVRARYFVREGDGERVRADIRSRVRFDWLNLAADTYPSLGSGISSMHLILCRNVLIYLTPDAIAHVARRLYDALAPGGWLVTGASDPPLADLAPFQAVLTSAGLVYRRPAQETAARGADRPVERTAVPGPVAVTAPEPSHRRPASPVGPRSTVPLEDVRARLHSLADRGEHVELTRLLGHALRAHPLDSEMHYISALLSLEQGQHEAAMAAARRALYLEPGLAVAAVLLGSACRALGDHRAAERAYRSAAAALRGRSPHEAVRLGGGERTADLQRAIDSLLALVGS